MKRGIKGIIFDVGGVLALPINPIKVEKGRKIAGVHSAAAKKLGISLDQWFDSIDAVYAKSIEGKIPKEKVLKTMAKNNHVSESKIKKIILRIYRENFKQNKELFKKTSVLKKKGYKIAVLSDQWYLSKEAIMPTKLYKNFDEVVVSCDVGVRKPNPKIYRLILKKLKSPAKQVLFIDNQEWNLKPARKLGMKTILYKNNKQLFQELDKMNL